MAELMLDHDVEDIQDAESTEAAEDAASLEAAEEGVGESELADATDAAAAQSRTQLVGPRHAMLCGLTAVVALAVLVGWLGFRAYQSHEVQVQRSQYLQVARQGALNLTTIDWQHADADVHRIMDGATGKFYDDFAQRSQPFIDLVNKFKSTSVGEVTEAGLESETGDTAQVLVAVTVQVSYAGVPDEIPRAWRMRMSVQKVDDQLKISNVGFVP
ncbi:mammalian cell entry protein [[Mycobacterium] crassicus]|uniref:Mammalian cell entry protein n=1 Tax=[Mycobacterium] crassicus TaxID=2872309 RepID=A0ABU5XK84_9MYCO|nr:mammalian cell entry protein [Mycolicibacter sp. MYC098]MEB3022685.1 mammalian cell entry protein [Mycolicibacter sp. MYC098]